MKRLTVKDWDSVSGSVFDAVRRLQEIENILGDTYDLDHLRELVEADKAGSKSIGGNSERTVQRLPGTARKLP